MGCNGRQIAVSEDLRGCSNRARLLTWVVSLVICSLMWAQGPTAAASRHKIGVPRSDRLSDAAIKTYLYRSAESTRIFYGACPTEEVVPPLDDECSTDEVELFSMDASGDEVLRLTENSSFEVGVVASPHHHRIATTMSPSGGCNPGEDDFDEYIATLDFDGRNEKAITPDGDAWCDYPVEWSQDGRRILITRGRLGANVVTVRVKTLETTALTHHGDESFSAAWGIGWMDDGRRVVFGEHRKNSTDVFSIRVDGSGRELIGRDNISESGVILSPDRRWLAFLDGSQTDGDIFVMRTNGERFSRVIKTPKRREWGPRWSPDSKRLLFLSENAKGTTDVGLVGRDGSGFQLLADARVAGASHTRAEWSPGGEAIAFAVRRDEGLPPLEAIFTVASDGSELKQLTEWGPIVVLWAWLTEGV